MRRVTAVAATLLVALLAGVGLAPPALAHNTLTGSDPADGSTVSSAPSSVTLTFDQPVQNYEPVLVVTGPNGNRYSSGSPEVSGPQVSIALTGAGPAGRYVAAYRIVSADGHPVSGQISYTLGEQAAGTAPGLPPADGAQPPTEQPADTGGSSGAGWWLWVGIGVAAVLVIAAMVVVVRRPGGAEDD